jgi:hypothetical protein
LNGAERRLFRFRQLLDHARDGLVLDGVCLFQTLASKRRRGPSGLPPTRADLYR